MNSSQSEDIFKMAGLEKNTLLGKWEFLFQSPFSLVSGTCTPAQTQEEDDRMKMIDEIDLDTLSVSNPCTPVDQASQAEVPSGQESKSKKKKSKKKKSASKSSSRCVKWGNVEQIYFSRTIGYDRIPNKGYYPIGLGVEQERELCTIDELYDTQQRYLLQLAVSKGLPLKYSDDHPPPPPPMSSPSPQITSSKGRKGRSNSVSSVGSVGSVDSATMDTSSHQSTAPAFSPTLAVIDLSRPLETRQFDFKSATNPLFHSLGEDERITLLTSNTVDIAHDPGSSVNPLTEINNEIKSLKTHRESSGCNCKHIKADKLSMTKLRSELLATKHLICYEASEQEIEKLPKAELMKKVKEALKQCVLCVTNDCHCVQLGIQCSAQICGCLRGNRTPGQQAQSCANPAGIDVYDPVRVKEYRRNILQGLGGIGPSTADKCAN